MARISGIASLFTSLIVTSTTGQVVYDCPVGWPSFDDRCYHFVFYPTLPYDEASQACHHDGARLVSVNTAEKHNFLVNWLSRYDGSRLNQWYTSGLQRNGYRRWAGGGDSLAGVDTNWVIDPTTEAQVAQTFSEAHLVYQYSADENRFGWAWASRTLSLPYICEIRRDELYRVFQQGRDFSYGSVSSDPNTWQVGPKFLHVSPSIVFAGRAQFFNLECSASGNPPPTYEWYREFGTEHQQLVTPSRRYTLTNGRLSVANPNERDDAGTYTCVATNSVGSVFSSPVQVSAGYLDEFSNDRPGSRIAKLYQGAVIDCSPPNFNPALVFQWMKGDRFIRPEMNQHTYLSENGNLYFSEVQAADAAEYTCIVTLTAPPDAVLATSQPLYGNSLGIQLNIDGEDANEFGPEIHDDFPAVFPGQPMRGKEMRIECMAYGRLPLYYSWSRVDGGHIPMDRTTFSSLNRVMHIAGARLEDSGVYMCTVVGPKNVDTKNISISVAARPYFLFPLLDQHLDVGSQLTWVCDAVAIPRATYAWYRDSQLLTSGSDIQVNKNVLSISSANAEKHNGMYECMATNDFGTQTSIAQIRVLSFKPNFDKFPVRENMMGTVGGNLTLRCQPEAAPQPTITWTHNGAPVGSSGHAQVMPNGNLVLSGLTGADAGVYTCVAENSLGTAESHGRLSILQETTLVWKPVNTKVHQNSSAHIPCQASFAVNKTDLVYVWYFNNRLLDIVNEPSLIIDEQAGIQGLYILNAQFEHQGWYECRATTVYDSVRAAGFLTVWGPPDEPAGVHVHSLEGSKVTLWWQPGADHGESASQYRIEISNNFNSAWQLLVESIRAQDTQVDEYPQWRKYDIDANALSPGTSYHFRVSAASPNYGYGRRSLPSDFVKLDDAAPIHAPAYVSGGGGSVGMLRVMWPHLPPEDHGGSGLYYKVYWRLHHNPDDMWRASEDRIYPSQGKMFGCEPYCKDFVWFHHKVGEENFYRQYDVKVQALNNMGAGPNTSVEIVMSAEDIPVTTPQQVYAEGLNATAGIVYWELPNNTREGVRGRVLGYQINWWHWGQDEDREIIKFIRHYGPEKSGTVIGLFANDDYWVDVQVFNSAGLSRPSGRAYLNTNYEAPLHYPDMVTVQSYGPDSVQVFWRGVSTVQVEAPVSGYKIWYWPATDNIRTAKVAEFGKVFSGVITGLEKDKLYQLRVFGTSSGGDGKKTPPTFFTLGGQVRYDVATTEVMASAALLKPSLIIIVCLAISSLTL